MTNYFPVLLANIYFNHDNWEEESNGNSKTPQKKKKSLVDYFLLHLIVFH